MLRKMALLCLVILYCLPAYAQEAGEYSDPFIRFTLPEGWVVCACDPAANILDAANSEAALSATGDAFTSGMIKLRIIKVFSRFTGGTPAAPLEVVESIMEGNAGNMTYTPATAFDLNGIEAIRTDFTGTVDDATAAGILIGVPLSNGDVTLINAVTPDGEIQAAEETILTIAASLTYNGSLAPETNIYATENFALTLPENWQLAEVDGNVLLLGSSAEVVAAVNQNRDLDYGALASGQAAITVYKSLNGFVGQVIDMTRTADAILLDMPTFYYAEADNAQFDSSAVEGQDAVAQMDVTTTTSADRMAVVALENADWALVVLSTPAGETDTYQAEFQQVIDSLRLPTEDDLATQAVTIEIERDLTETYAATATPFAFNYPLPWTVLESESLIFVGSSEDAFSRPDLNSLIPGDLIGVIYPTLALNPDYPTSGGEAPSTVVSFYASIGFTENYLQDGAMEVFDAPDGRSISASLASNGQHDRLVVAIDNGQGDISTLVAYSKVGEMYLYRQTLLDMMMSSAGQ